MKLRHIAFAEPVNAVSSETVAEWSGLRRDFIEDKVGIRSRRLLQEGENPVDLAAEACKALLSKSGGPRPEDIRLLVVVTQNPDFRIPHSSALLQQKLGLGADTAAFDISLGCSGYVYALSVVRGMMLGEGFNDALLVTCDPYSRIMGKSDRDTIALFGDAATASWLSAGGGAEIGAVDFGTDGGGAGHLIVRAGGAHAPISGLYQSAGLADGEMRDYRLHMNGRGIFNFMMERVPRSIDLALVKNNLAISDIDTFVFHQGSQFLLQQLVERLGIDPARVPSNIGLHGNTVSSSIPLLLHEMAEKGQLAGKRVLISGFGVGLSWATTVLTFPG